MVYQSGRVFRIMGVYAHTAENSVTLADNLGGRCHGNRITRAVSGARQAHLAR